MIALVCEEAHWAMNGVEEKLELQVFYSFFLSGDHQGHSIRIRMTLQDNVFGLAFLYRI